MKYEKCACIKQIKSEKKIGVSFCFCVFVLLLLLKFLECLFLSFQPFDEDLQPLLQCVVQIPNGQFQEE